MGGGDQNLGPSASQRVLCCHVEVLGHTPKQSAQNAISGHGEQMWSITETQVFNMILTCSDHISFMQMLDENHHLIQCIMDYQSKGKTAECTQ